MAQLKARRVKKTYLALVQGSVAAAVGRIEAPIGRDPKHRTQDGGRARRAGRRRPATAFASGSPAGRCSSSTSSPGRTHQIRVHLDAIGHPVAGDPVYGTGTSRRGPDGLGRLFLHAWRLELDLAVGRPPHPRDGAAPAGARVRPATRLRGSRP